ncbi:unnamed protein product, partial [marine sediment metagenome]
PAGHDGYTRAGLADCTGQLVHAADTALPPAAVDRVLAQVIALGDRDSRDDERYCAAHIGA